VVSPAHALVQPRIIPAAELRTQRQPQQIEFLEPFAQRLEGADVEVSGGHGYQ